MIIEVDIYKEIRALYEHGGISKRAIARRLGISRNTVDKYCDGSQVPWERQGVSGRQRYVVTDDDITFIESCLEADEAENIKKQSHTAKRIYELLKEKGFTGGESTVREIVAKLKDKQAKVFLPLSFDPGEAGQIDWGEATVYLAGQKIKINLFCIRECYSADIHCTAFYRQNEESFLEGHIKAFEFFGGIPKRIIFDNARVAVKEGFGAHAKVQDRYKAFSAHYAFGNDFCNIGAGHEKGLVEGLVGWVRRNILVPIPRVDAMEQLNKEIESRCLKYRQHKIAGRVQTVGEMAKHTRLSLAQLPKYRFDPSKSITARVDSFSTVKFDYNYYSVPVEYAGKEVSIKGYGNSIQIMHQNKELAIYPRCYKRGETKYQLEHYLSLIEQRPRSVFNAKPVKSNVSAKLLEIGKKLSGPREMVKLLRLLVDYGEDKLISTIETIHSPELTIEQISSHLIPTQPPQELYPLIEVHVTKPQFNRYDELMAGGVS